MEYLACRFEISFPLAFDFNCGGATRHSTSQNRAFAFKFQWDYQATFLSAGNSRACAPAPHSPVPYDVRVLFLISAWLAHDEESGANGGKRGPEKLIERLQLGE